MPRNETVDHLKVHIIPILQKHGVRKASLFGSVARGDATPSSDVDILVDLPPEKSILDLIDLKLELEAALGRDVDLAEYNTIHPLLRERVMAEQVAVL